MNLEAADPDPGSLENLHDIVEPSAVPWWPLAPGWYAVGAIALLAVLWLGLRWIKHYRANRYRREALAELDQIHQRARVPEDRRMALSELAVLIKRVALVAYPRTEVASLSGDAWRHFLNLSGQTAVVTPETTQLMADAVYGAADDSTITEDAVRELFSAAEVWVRGHCPSAEQ